MARPCRSRHVWQIADRPFPQPFTPTQSQTKGRNRQLRNAYKNRLYPTHKQAEFLDKGWQQRGGFTTPPWNSAAYGLPAAFRYRNLQPGRHIGVIARFVAEITLSHVRLCSLGRAELQISCPRNMASCFDPVRNMGTNRERSLTLGSQNHEASGVCPERIDKMTGSHPFCGREDV